MKLVSWALHCICWWPHTSAEKQSRVDGSIKGAWWFQTNIWPRNKLWQIGCIGVAAKLSFWRWGKSPVNAQISPIGLNVSTVIKMPPETEKILYTYRQWWWKRVQMAEKGKWGSGSTKLEIKMQKCTGPLVSEGKPKWKTMELFVYWAWGWLVAAILLGLNMSWPQWRIVAVTGLLM